MITISLRNNFDKVIRELDTLPEEIANKAMARALNSTIDYGKLQMARTISEEFRISVTEVKKRLDIQRARYRGQLRLYVSLQATRSGFNGDSRGMNLINFVSGGIPKRKKNGAMRQLGLQIKRSGGRKVIPGAFVATNKRTGGTAVFIREGKERMPIRTLTTIDVSQMFNTKRINESVRSAMLDKFEPALQREIGAVLRGFLK